MLRYLGVPARYVEGFYLSGDEAAVITPGSAYTLDASHAHAWAEFYLRGIGWIPFETTPGYEDNEEFSLLTQLTRKASASSGDGSEEENSGPKFPEKMTLTCSLFAALL